jgi:ribose-phosphate pyrophosphokinase
MFEKLKVIGGTSSLPLVEDICSYLSGLTNTDIEPIKLISNKTENGEMYVEVCEEVTGCHVFVVQSFNRPINDNIIELMMILDTLHSMDVAEISLVVPYFGYNHNKTFNFENIPHYQRVIANIIQTSQIKRIITIGHQSHKLRGLFNIPLININDANLLSEYVLRDVTDYAITTCNRNIEHQLEYWSQKVKHEIIANSAESYLNNVFEDRRVILIDSDLTEYRRICSFAKMLHKKGAKSINCYISHGIITEYCFNELQDSKINHIYITNTVTLPKETRKNLQFTIIEVDEVLAQTMLQVYRHTSLSYMVNTFL